MQFYGIGAETNQAKFIGIGEEKKGKTFVSVLRIEHYQSIYADEILSPKAEFLQYDISC